MHIPLPKPGEPPVDQLQVLALTIELAEQLAALCELGDQPDATLHFRLGINLLREEHSMLRDLRESLEQALVGQSSPARAQSPTDNRSSG